MDQEIQFLKDYHQNSSEEIATFLNRKGKNPLFSCSQPGPTTNFSAESSSGLIRPVGIRDEKDAQIIRNALTIECSSIAQKKFILYRGANFERDSTSHMAMPPYKLQFGSAHAYYEDYVKNAKEKEEPYRLSFGSSLFAGALFDSGATAFHYMRNEKNGYAITIPFSQLNKSPFFIPPTNTTSQLFGDGEVFHARTKAWDGSNLRTIGGIHASPNSHARDHLQSELSKEVMLEQFKHYKRDAIQLK